MIGISANPVKEKIHGAQTGDIGNKVNSMQGPSMQICTLLRIHCPTLEMVKGRKQKTACAARWIRNAHHWFRSHYFDDCTNHGARCEVLPSAASHIFSISSQQSFINFALHVLVKFRPVFTIN